MDFDFIRYLVNAGCDINATYSSTDSEANLLCLAVQLKDVELIRFLSVRLSQDQLDYRMRPSPNPAYTKEPFWISFTPLMLSIVMPYMHSNDAVNPIAFEIVKTLVDAGANTQLTENTFDDNLFHLACKYSTDVQLSEYLFNNINLDLNGKNNEGMTPRDICRADRNEVFFQQIDIADAKRKGKKVSAIESFTGPSIIAKIDDKEVELSDQQRVYISKFFND